MADLITLTNWQTERGLTVQADAQESLIISACSARIEEFCQRTFAQATYTEILSGNNSSEICLRNRPLTTTGLSVWVDNNARAGQATGAFDSTTLQVLGTDYYLKMDQPDGVTSRSGILVRVNSYWYWAPTFQGGTINPTYRAASGNIKVTYTGGFATVPLDVQQACMMLCAAVKARAALGEQYESESKENYQYRFRPYVKAAFAAMPADTLGILARYRNMGVG